MSARPTPRPTLALCAAALLAGTLLPGCGDDAAAKEARKEGLEALDSLGKLAAQRKQEFLESFRSNADELGDRIDALKAKAAERSGATREAMDAKIAELVKKREALQERMKEVAAASGDAWKDLGDGAQQAYAELERALAEAAENFDSK